MAQEEVIKLSLPDLVNKLQAEFKKKKYTTRLEWKSLHWACVQILRLADAEQPQHLDYIDEVYIKSLRAEGYSYEDIAFILDRSKSSIHAYCKHNGLRTEY